MQARVTLLDGSIFTCTVEVRQLETGETECAGWLTLHLVSGGETGVDRWRKVRVNLPYDSLFTSEVKQL